MEAVSVEAFCGQLKAGHELSSPVRVIGGGTDAVAMSTGDYDNLVDPDIQYFIYESEADREVWDLLTIVAIQKEMNLNELFVWMIERGLGRKEVFLKNKIHAEPWQGEKRIRLIRYYPVEKGETEIQARRRAMEEEEDGYE